MIIIFIALYLMIFVVYASMYSSTMQDLNKNYRILNVEGVNIEKLKSRIDSQGKKVSKLKKIIWIPTCAVLITHLIGNGMTSNIVGIDYLFALIPFVSTIILILIINWMKGAGTIDSKPRLPGQTRI